MQAEIRECPPEGGNAEEPVCGTDAKAISLELAALNSNDMALCLKWRNDYRVWKWCRQNDLISDQDQVNWFQKQSADPTIKMYKIVLGGGETRRIIGVCGLTSIDMTNRRAEFSLYIDPDLFGRGLGTKSLRLLLDHAFGNLGLGLVWGEVFDQNPAMRIFQKLGFRTEGLRRDFYFRDGKFINAHLISIKRDEWTGSLS